MRRRFEPIELSLTILIGPMKPSACTCVPPHSSVEGPASSTRTISPYFSPKNAIARPAAKALGGGVGKGADAVVGGGPNADGVDEALRLVREQAATWGK